MTPDPVDTTTSPALVFAKWLFLRAIPKAFRWLHAPIVDTWPGISLNRLLAMLFASAAVHGSLMHERPVTLADIGMATLAGALAFGKDAFLAFVERNKKEEG